MALPWIFIHGTNIVGRCLIVLFFSLFCHFSVLFSIPPGIGLIVLSFVCFFGYFSGLFSVGPPLPGKFSADALALSYDFTILIPFFFHRCKNAAEIL